MGGDALLILRFTAGSVGNCGTIALGGLETVDGARGFVVAAHSIAESGRSDISSDTPDLFVGHYEDENYHLHHLLGKPLRMPSTRTEGGEKILSVDAAFVKYPHPYTPNCSLAWQRNGESFCLDDTDQTNYIDRITPLTIRGEDSNTYRVTGSQQPTRGLEVTYSGTVSGPGKKTNSTVGEKILVVDERRDLLFFLHYTNNSWGIIGGDSGSPIYTTPDTDGNVRIVGVLHGFIASGILSKRALFSSWNDVSKELNLKPISP